MKSLPSKTINILGLTSQSLKKGELKHILPEYYQLKGIAENNPWHLNQNVFDHVVGVLRGLEIVLQFKFLSTNLQQKARRYFLQKIGKYTRKEIMMVATILHDIAKPSTLIKNTKTGTTACPGHEMIGSFLAHEMGQRFGLRGESLAHLERIVLYHGFVHDILGLCLGRGPVQKYLKLLSDIADSVHLELLFLAYADMLGSDLPKVSPAEFSKRQTILTEAIKTAL